MGVDWLASHLLLGRAKNMKTKKIECERQKQRKFCGIASISGVTDVFLALILKLKGPSQPHLCFCLHVRIWLVYFIRSLSKRRKITVKLLKII